MNHSGHVSMDQTYKLEVAGSWKGHAILRLDSTGCPTQAQARLGRLLEAGIADWAAIHTPSGIEGGSGGRNSTRSTLPAAVAPHCRCCSISWPRGARCGCAGRSLL